MNNIYFIIKLNIETENLLITQCLNYIFFSTNIYVINKDWKKSVFFNEFNLHFFDHRISCLQLLISGQVDFTTVEPADLMILGMTEEYNNKVLVLHELRLFKKSKNSFYGLYRYIK